MPTPPMKIIYLDRCYPIGDAWERARYSVCTGRREALVITSNHRRLPNGAWDGGGDFYCYKTKLSHGTRLILPNVRRNNSPLEDYHCMGVSPAQMKPSAPGSVFWPVWEGVSGVRANAAAHYATGYARTRPGNPVADLGQFLIELRDLPQMPFRNAATKIVDFPFRRTGRVAEGKMREFLGKKTLNRSGNTRRQGFSSNLGNEYLNVVFGWKPFVRDLQRMYALYHDIDRQLAKLRMENGRYIRRKAKLLSDTVTTMDINTVYPTPYVNVYGQPPSWMTGTTHYTKTTKVRTRVWFSASYRYYIPDTGSSEWDARARLALFGGLPTPELLWEVMPWSWLIDWFGNVGDVISNASPNAVDNLTCRYSFVMKEIVTTVTWRAHVCHTAQQSLPSDYFKSDWPAVDHTFETVFETTQKVRVGGGNPFGLDVGLLSLNEGQLAILAALGISRSKVR